MFYNQLTELNKFFLIKISQIKFNCDHYKNSFKHIYFINFFLKI